jgi:peptidoglycan/xylan/chitin deacetylase (PgdA/CDA1 family)
MQPTNVILTVDIEFSIAGAFTDPLRFKPLGQDWVLGSDGITEHGLGFLLDTLQHHKARATFFVEALNTAYFGPEPMGEIARRIRDAGHDVQLHIHPCWLAFDDGPYVRKPGSPPPNDQCGSFPPEAFARILQRAVDIFERWGVARPVALRTGGFNVSRNVYLAQRLAGIPLASNVCASIAPSVDDRLRFRSGRHLVEGIVEAPALSFVDYRRIGKEHLRPFQITAVSSAELRLVLSRVNQAGLDTVVTVTHAFEYFKLRDERGEVRANRINQKRLEALCAAVSRDPDRLRWSTFGELAAQWQVTPFAPEVTVPGSMRLAAMRMIENAANDRIWWL